MGDEAEERLVCKLKVGMRVGRFKLKIHLRNRLMSSSWKLHRLSFVVRFRKHHLRIDSESKPECGCKSRFGGFIRSLGVLWRRRVEEKVGSKKKMDEEGIWNGSLGFSADLDLRCEELIKEEFGERCNFDVDDAVQRLDKLGIVARDTIGRYYCMGLKRANEIIGTTTEELVHKAKQGVTPS
ncbi:hypothetical protein F2Q68_00023624 [Brassica cretica]|uniref:Uncharacterized protein n=1 Tax=Brassica cretica TaxID=69181 RepID=A0A8S9FQM0_BRACR|nr:hypothetical protein F2Q68_00023624 [Brassica cretica]